MLPWLIYRDPLRGSESTQQASLPVHSTGHSHEADSISKVHLAPHANDDLSRNGAGAKAWSRPTVVIHFGIGDSYAHRGWVVPSLGARVSSDTPRLRHSLQPRATGNNASREVERP